MIEKCVLFRRLSSYHGRSNPRIGKLKRFPLRKASEGGRVLQRQKVPGECQIKLGNGSDDHAPEGFRRSSNKGGYAMTSGIIRRAFLAAALALPFMAASGLAHADGERFVFVSHAPDSDSWWNTIKNALKNAEHDWASRSSIAIHRPAILPTWPALSSR